jgi:hypothetical protein
LASRNLRRTAHPRAPACEAPAKAYFQASAVITIFAQHLIAREQTAIAGQMAAILGLK